MEVTKDWEPVVVVRIEDVHYIESQVDYFVRDMIQYHIRLLLGMMMNTLFQHCGVTENSLRGNSRTLDARIDVGRKGNSLHLRPLVALL